MTTSRDPDASRPSAFSAVRKVGSLDEIVTQIEDAILTGRFTTRRTVAQGARAFPGVRRQPPATARGIAFARGLGLLDIRPGRAGGIYVVGPSGDSVGSALEALLRFRKVTRADLSEFRVSFEGETAAWAARRAEPDDHERRRTIAATAKAAAACDAPWDEIAPRHLQFHEAAGKNEVRVAAILAIHGALKHAGIELGSVMHDD